MKKVFALVLCLMMLPLFAMAETQPVENWVTVDLGDFSMNMLATDMLQKGVKAEGQIMFMAYPRYSEANTFHANINCAWTAQSLNGIEAATQDELNTFAMDIVDSAKMQLEQQSIGISNTQLVEATYDTESGALIIYYIMDYDYSALGIDTKITLNHMQFYISSDESGTYCFSLTALDEAQLLDMIENYFSTIQFY